MIEGLLDTGKFQVISLGGAMKHKEYKPIKIDQYGEDWKIFPVDGFGTPDIIRSVLRHEKPDILWFMTDPRFYEWLWAMEDEIRPLIPMVYYHVWDNYPYPMYNKVFYSSTDIIVAISKVTHDIVKTVVPKVESHYLPHAVSPTFKELNKSDSKKMKKENFPQWEGKDKFLFFWNNRNARRKQSGTLIWWFKEFLDKVGHDKAALLMHTDPEDMNGPNLHAILHDLNLVDGQVMFSKEKLNEDALAAMYNMADCTINISDAEGFGLSTLESLSCGTPIIVTMTGGLQEQVTDGENWFGIGLESCSKAIIGSQEVPYIQEDRVNKEMFIDALEEMYNLSPDARAEMGRLGAQHVEKNYNFENYVERWDEILTDLHERHGSWSDRKIYQPYVFKEIQ
jgi:glycosyltransferase involved in cell wall biosynthesis